MIKVILLLALLTYTSATCVSTTSPTVQQSQISEGANTMWVLDTAGNLWSSSKSVINYVPRSIPNGYTAISVDVGTNDDVAVVDQFNNLYVLKYGQSNWVSIPTPVGAQVVDIYAYASNAMVMVDIYGNVWKFGSGSWSQISSGVYYTDATIAADGSIFGTDGSGNLLQYSSGTTWTSLFANGGYYQVSAGLSYNDVVAVSSTFPIIDYRRNGSNLNQIGTTLNWLSIYNGNVLGTDGSRVYVC